MKNIQIIKAPLVTEKAMKIKEVQNKYTFEVANNANKNEIKQEVEKYFKVNVVKVNVLKNKGKTKRSWGKLKKPYRKPDVKKAVVELKSGDTIKFFEGSSKK